MTVSKKILTKFSPVISAIIMLCGCSMLKAPSPQIVPCPAPGAKLKTVYHHPGFYEGPAWNSREQKLYFTAFGSENGKKSQRIMQLDKNGKASVWLDSSGGVNGMFMSADNKNLLGAVYMRHQVVAITIKENKPGEIKVLSASPEWFQPNDICQAPNGRIYFTDPDFKKRQHSKVFLLNRRGITVPIITDMKLPNGLITSPDGTKLYVSDSYMKYWKVYPLKADGTAGKGRIFFAPHNDNRQDPDGMTVDRDGNLYFTGRGGVWIVNPKGQRLGMIKIPEFCSNCTFGGKDGKTLFITAKNKVYAIKMTVPGNLTH